MLYEETVMGREENDLVDEGRDDAPDRATSEEGSDDGGDAACWAHLVCPECGGVILNTAHSHS